MKKIDCNRIKLPPINIDLFTSAVVKIDRTDLYKIANHYELRISKKSENYPGIPQESTSHTDNTSDEESETKFKSNIDSSSNKTRSSSDSEYNDSSDNSSDKISTGRKLKRRRLKRKSSSSSKEDLHQDYRTCNLSDFNPKDFSIIIQQLPNQLDLLIEEYKLKSVYYNHEKIKKLSDLSNNNDIILEKEESKIEMDHNKKTKIKLSFPRKSLKLKSKKQLCTANLHAKKTLMSDSSVSSESEITLPMRKSKKPFSNDGVRNESAEVENNSVTQKQKSEDDKNKSQLKNSVSQLNSADETSSSSLIEPLQLSDDDINTDDPSCSPLIGPLRISDEDIDADESSCSPLIGPLRISDEDIVAELPESYGDSLVNQAKDDLLDDSDTNNHLEEEESISDTKLNNQNKSQNMDEDLDDLPEVVFSKSNGDIEEETEDGKDSGDDKKNKKALKGDLPKSNGDSLANVDEDDSPEKITRGAGLKSKRRKALALSSDSESGNMKKVTSKSDPEESEEESTVKKSKKKRNHDSDYSEGSSSDSKSTKKRRRIKHVDESEASDSESETEGKKHGRKNIRKVMGKNQLEEATKKAAREEKERIARITERQKLYNNLLFDESGKPDEVVLDKVVLDFEPDTKEPLIQVDPGLVKKLKPHQANGIKFMWDACFESVKRIKKDKGSGCILAHCMGLGKTLQVVSLTHTLLTHSDLTGVKRVLVVCPLSTVLNWVNEFNMWLKHTETEYDVDVYELSKNKQNLERAYHLKNWYEGGGVCVLGYEMFRNLSADNSKKYRKKVLRVFQESLVNPGPDLVVCDEGHLLKNEKTSLSQSMNRVKTMRRIVLTGTPLQNNLREYYCMVQFVKPNLLGKYNEYLNRFVNPITNGQYTDSTEHDIKIMKRRSHVLHKMLDGAVQRRDYGVLAPFLPPKHEYVLFITLTDVQIKLYQFYLDTYSRRPLPGKSSGFLFPDFQSLQRIWTHPLVLKYNSERYEIMQQKKREKEEEEDSEGSLADFIDDESTTAESTSADSTDDLSDASDGSHKKKKKKLSKKKSKVSGRRGTRANPEQEESVVQVVEEAKNENPTEWWIKLVTDDELEDMRNSHKLVLLFDILRQCETIGDKLLVFSQSLYSLDLIEHYLGKVDDATQEGRIDEKLGGHVGSWTPGVDYFRLDGSTSCENRSIWCKNFNREDNPRARLFLISTRAGGLGINLVAANRVVIFDVSWNPSHDVQSIFRVYRFGQKKPCYVYRFLAMGTMEEKIYERQVTKQAISKRVIDEQQIDRHYAENDLAELYKFEAKPPEPRPIPPLPKDRLFAEMLREHEAQIYKYHEHDSLLENKEEETLTEEERKAAWEDFENEKTKPPPAPFPNMWPMNNAGLVPHPQQILYAAVANVLRKDMPNITDSQIRDLLPLMCNANPALMQKVNDMYKYSQTRMMTPAFMNMMNSAGGAMGSSSGLQYEPPWQRQQQQQQQMRLQQLMRQQNAQQQQMGAKFYAGGLGSRDPVAMALQQHISREMGEAARSRPRGRPPLQASGTIMGGGGLTGQGGANAAPKPSNPEDVVNLDSD